MPSLIVSVPKSNLEVEDSDQIQSPSSLPDHLIFTEYFQTTTPKRQRVLYSKPDLNNLARSLSLCLYFLDRSTKTASAYPYQLDREHPELLPALLKSTINILLRCIPSK